MEDAAVSGFHFLFFVEVQQPDVGFKCEAAVTVVVGEAGLDAYVEGFEFLLTVECAHPLGIVGVAAFCRTADVVRIVIVCVVLDREIQRGTDAEDEPVSVFSPSAHRVLKNHRHMDEHKMGLVLIVDVVAVDAVALPYVFVEVIIVANQVYAGAEGT